jgi:hypothetical protein
MEEERGMIMDIEIVKEAKLQCESEIRAILHMFEQQSGCTVHGIDIMRVARFGMGTEIVNICIDVRVNTER